MAVVSRTMRILVLFAVLIALAHPAWAAIYRPNALDRQVDAIPAARLLHAPAIALVDPDRQEAAARFTRWKEPGWFAMIVFEILILGYFWQSGTAARFRDWLRARVRSDFFVRFLFGCGLGALAKCVALPFEFYLYRVNRVMGLSAQLSRGWIGDWLAALLLDMLLAGCVAAIVLWLADRTRRWYIYTIFAVFVGSAIVCGFDAMRLMRIPDTLVVASTPGEIEFYTVREIVHVKLGDPMRLALIEAFIVIIGAALAVLIADRIGFRRDDDPLARLALVGALLGVMYLIAVPIDNACSRAIEGQADAYAIAVTHDPTSAVRAMIRRADEQIESPCPGPLAQLYFLRSPAIGTRVQAFNGVPSDCH